MSELNNIVSGFLSIIQVALHISLIVAGIGLVVVGGYSVVKGRGAKWYELMFAAATLILVAFGIANYPPILIRSVNEAIEQSQPEMIRLTGNIEALLDYSAAPVITPTVYVLPPTPVPAMTVAPTTAPTVQPTATIPSIMLPAVTATPSPVPTLDPAQWNPATPPPTRSR
jgi:hypothetical protein